MVLIILRTLIIFITLLIIIRLMGKRQIGEMQPFELVITLIIAELACIPMADTSIPLFYGIASIVTIYLAHQAVCFTDLYLKKFKYVVSGKPSVVINKSGVDYTQLKKNNLDVSDLIESMRNAGYFALESIDYALYEANGSFSALKNENYDSKNTSLPVLIIDRGRYQKDNLKLIRLNADFFDGILKENGIKSAKKVSVMTLDGNGNIYLQEKNKKFKAFNRKLEEGVGW